MLKEQCLVFWTKQAMLLNVSLIQHQGMISIRCCLLLQGGTHLQYPPASVEKAIQGIFLEGSTEQAAWHTKLALLVYYLLDAGLVADAGDLM
jgi:hypothetical protein